MKKIDLKPESERISVSAEQNARYIDSLSKMIACKTVYSPSGENNGEFKRFYSLIQELFPTLSQRAQRLEFGTGCFVYTLCVLSYCFL